MSPLTDAMRFVNRDLIDVPVFQIRQKSGEHQTLRRDIQQFVFTIPQAQYAPAGFIRGKR